MFSNLSALNENSKGRLYDVTPDHRLPYERDRDRIYHSTAFRKLKDKFCPNPGFILLFKLKILPF